MATGFTQRFKGKIVGAYVNAQAMNYVVSPALTASTTQTRIGGTPLPALLNYIATCATAGNAVTLKPMVPGDFQVVMNRAATNAASVFPNSAAVGIDAGAAGAAATLSAGNRAIFWCLTPTLIVSTLLGAVSA
jgi:hypothetical protein